MKVDITTSGLAEASVALKKAPRTLVELNERSALRIGSRAVQKIRREYRSAPETTATATAVRTGNLRRMYDAATRRDGEAVELDLGLIRSGIDQKILRYAAVHENDGTTIIRAKSGKYLAIPLPAARTRAGVARGGPRDYPNTFLIKGMGGSPIIATYTGGARNWSKSKVIPLFVLKREIRVKGRPALQPVARSFVIPELQSAIERNFASAVDGGGSAA